jgi:hypothetical protein
MSELRSVPDLLARSDRSFARTQHRMCAIKVWALGFIGCLYIGSLVLTVAAFVNVWRGGDWLSYWVEAISVFPAGMALARFALLRDSRADLFAPVAVLRQAIREGDASLAPVAAPAPAPTSDAPGDSGQLGSLRRPAATGTVATLWGIAVFALFVPCIGAPIALNGGNSHLALVLVAAALPPGLICILLGRRFMSPLFVRIDANGLRWRRPLGLTAFAAWRDVRGFFSLTYARSFGDGRETLYVLDCGEVVLAWRANADATSSASLHSPSLTLYQLSTEHTGLSLRDVTVQAKRIAQGAEKEVPLPPHSASMRNRASSSRVSKGEVRHRLRVLGVVLSPSLIVVLVSLLAMLVQAPYYDHLYLQAHTHGALYRDALTHADGDWPDNTFAQFDQGIYHFQEAGNQIFYPTYVMAPRRYGRALVEVSGRTGGDWNLGGVGFAISDPSLSALLTFIVAPDGSWWIGHVSTTEPYWTNDNSSFGDMSAIHRGFGVWNHIAVLMNGSDFTFYVNGQYATSYHDDALKGGEVGLYLDLSTASGDFRDFAVYPM